MESSTPSNDLLELRPNRRRKSFWEPIFTEDKPEVFMPFDWSTSNITGIQRQTCNAKTLIERHQSERVSVLRNFLFFECDFLGEFDVGQFAFKACTFELCDLGRSTWRNIKFLNCTFRRCSLTQSTFDSCQFVDCTWSEIGFSGNETHIKACLFTNPSEFVLAGYTNLDPEVLSQQKGDNRKATYQQMRLEQTKLKISRLVLNSSETQGNDEGYYQAVKTYLNQSVDAKIAEIRYDIHEKKRPLTARIHYAFLHFERLILNASGRLNNWGASVAKPALIGVGLVAGFSIFYWLFGIQASFPRALMASFDITTLVGYTKHASKDARAFEQISYVANMSLGLWWYAIFVPTVINRISRVRA